jgi:hypothetical protein
MSTCPVWLVRGARVRVTLRSGESVRDYDAVVVGVEWPWLVFFEGMKGGAHPCRVKPR